MANITKVKFMSNASPKFKVDEEEFQAKQGFNEMPEKFTKDPYYAMCVESRLILDFVSIPTDKQQEDFDKQVQAERERADALQKELEELKAANAAQGEQKTPKVEAPKK